MSFSGRINQILDELEASLSGVAAFDTRATFQAENATYGEAYLKVGYKLGTALLVSKEVLLLVADFPEVQTRNIRIVRNRLARDAERLQQGVAIVAHRDPSGSARLRRWGREQGLTILPLNYATQVPPKDRILGMLLEDLYSYDRFDLTGPVRSEYQFFGRPFIPDLARRLTEGTIHALFGMRKIGKTSLLNRVLEELTEKHGCKCVMLDAQDDSLWALSAAELVAGLGQAVRFLVSSGENYTTVVPPDSKRQVVLATEAEDFLKAILQLGRPLIVLVDELDYITPSSPVASHWQQDFNPFFRALRRVYQESSRRGAVCSLVLSGVSSRWFMEESINGAENAALALVPEGYLAPLERAESIDMITTLGEACGLILSSPVANVIAQTASDNPFWIRKAGSFINSCYGSDRPARVTLADVETLCAEFVEVEGAGLAYSSLRHLFRSYPDLGFAAVAAIDGRSSDVSQTLLSSLGRYGILGEGTDASGPMVRAGILQWKADDSKQALVLPFAAGSPGPQKIEAGSVSSAGEEEWASLLGDVSRLRNALERRLRDLVLLVIRSEIASNDQRKPADVLRAAVPAERRNELQGLGASQILRRLYWSDLTQIVKKHWRWFEKTFGDRSKFELYADIVNDRPDAHAKELDGADLALQRRAIEWFEAGIDRSELL